MEWLGNPLLYVFVSFFGPDRAERSIAFRSQFANKKQRSINHEFWTQLLDRTFRKF